MLSTKKMPMDTSAQSEKHTENKVPPKVPAKMPPTTVTPVEQRKKIEGYDEIKRERKDDLKESKKPEKTQVQKEIVADTKLEHSKPKPVESINKCEVKVKILKAEEETKRPSDTAAKEATTTECKMTPVGEKSNTQKPSNVAVPRKCPPLSTPLLTERPLVVTTHLVPSLPIGLFEVFVEALEVATEKPVVLLYEPRRDRPVAKDVADIAILPASEEWDAGELLPASFCFEHRLNKSNSPCIYADVIVAADSAARVEDITDLRGHRCSLPDRRKKIGAAALLFNYLYTKGENAVFFGNTLDADTQVATLQMVAGKQAEVGILESPVIKCQRNLLPGVNSLHILTSLGPLPPYKIMVKKTLSDVVVKKITAYLLNIHQEREWLDRFAPYGVTSFSKNSAQLYQLGDVKTVVTSVPYY